MRVDGVGPEATPYQGQGYGGGGNGSYDGNGLQASWSYFAGSFFWLKIKNE